MGIRIKSVDTHLEQRILTGLIVSTTFCKRVLPILKIEYFRLPYARRVINWVQDYFSKYEKAPFSDIESIFSVEKNKMKESEAELIEEFLFALSQRYEHEGDINVDYLTDQAVGYFRKRSLEVLSDGIKACLDRDYLEDAERMLREYKKVAKEVSGWVNPFDPDFIARVFEKERRVLFSFPGELGKLIGPLERGWLVGVMGPMKRGKTWVLQEFAVQAVINRKRVLFVSLEMTPEEVGERLLCRISGSSFEEGDLIYPCFDCKKNQLGICNKPERASAVPLIGYEKGKIPKIEDAPPDYKPCTWCREVGLSDYEPAVWFFSVKNRLLNYQKAVQVGKSFTTMFGDRLRIKSYPPYSATLFQIEADIENLEYLEDFVPDVVVLDYADIIMPERYRKEERTQVNEVWKLLKRLAEEKHCLVVTATQTNREAIEKKNVSQVHTSEDIRKLAHVNLLLSLNQTPEEKNMGVMRIGVLVRRKGDFNPLRQVMVLSNLNAGQFHLDSEKVPEETTSQGDTP